MVHAAPAALLITAQDEPHPALEGDAAVLHGSQGIKGSHGRALIIDGAPAIEDSILNHSPKGRVTPAVPRVHHVQMG